MLKKEDKAKLVKEFGKSPKNTGSIAAQIAILTKEIELLTAHFQKNGKDLHSRVGFTAKIEKRKTLLNYYRKHDLAGYQELIKKLDLRK